MDDQQRDELENEQVDSPEEPVSVEPVEIPTAEDEVLGADGLADDLASLEIAYSQPNANLELLPSDFDVVQEALPVEPEPRVEIPAAERPLASIGDTLRQSPEPGMLNVGPQPHARRAPIVFEPQPSFETAEDVASAIIRGPYRPSDEPRQISDLLYRFNDPTNDPRIQLLSEDQPAPKAGSQATTAEKASDEAAPDRERAQTLPRLMVVVSMANARSIFQECLERAGQSLGAKFHNACQHTVNEYARERRAAERAANRWRG